MTDNQLSGAFSPEDLENAFEASLAGAEGDAILVQVSAQLEDVPLGDEDLAQALTSSLAPATPIAGSIWDEIRTALAAPEVVQALKDSVRQSLTRSDVVDALNDAIHEAQA